MSRKLSDQEIKQCLQQLRNVTHLHAIARDRLAKALATVKGLKHQLAHKDLRIAELETKLLNKDVQRKTLAHKLFKAKKQHADDIAEQTGKTKPGAQPEHQPYRRPVPAPETITDRQTFDLSVCPAC